MKTTTTSVIILIVIIVVLSVNSFLLNTAADDLSNRVDRLGDDPLQAAEEAKKLESYWKALEPYISLSVTYLKVDNITEAVTKLKIYAEHGEASEFMLAKETFKNSVDEIRFSGQLNLETIF